MGESTVKTSHNTTGKGTRERRRKCESTVAERAIVTGKGRREHHRKKFLAVGKPDRVRGLSVGVLGRLFRPGLLGAVRLCCRGCLCASYRPRIRLVVLFGISVGTFSLSAGLGGSGFFRCFLGMAANNESYENSEKNQRYEQKKNACRSGRPQAHSGKAVGVFFCVER